MCIGSQAITFRKVSLNRRNDNAVSACQPLLLISSKFLVWFLYWFRMSQMSIYYLELSPDFL